MKNYLPIISYTHLSTIGRFLAGTLVLSFFAYGFFLISTVSATAERRSLKTELEDLKSTVATLEIEYYEKVHALGIATVSEFGYHTTEPRFVDANGNAGAPVAVAQ